MKTNKNVNLDHFEEFDTSLIENHIALREKEAGLKVQRAQIINNFLSRALNLVLFLTVVLVFSFVINNSLYINT
tara:strand:+ start:291 stop:512 length:222 start_codon:yes stop_codon:yes gene_type:complete